MVNDAIFDEASGTYKNGAGGRAIELKNAKRLKKEEALVFLRMICKTKTSILMSEIDEIVRRDNPTTTNERAKYYTKEELLSDFKAEIAKGKLSITIIENTDVRMPFAKYFEIDEQLKTIHKDNLYDFLDLPMTASASQLAEKIKEKYRLSSTMSLKEKQSYSNICGACEEFLTKSVDNRKYYDIFILLKEDIWEGFKKRKERALTVLELTDYEACVETAKRIY